MEEFRVEQQANRFPALVNRFFSGCLPGRVTTIAAEAKCGELLSAIEANQFPEFQDTIWISLNLNLLQSLDRGIGEAQPQDDTPFRRSIFFWWLYENASGAQERQIIFFGSPGTGKTWEARRIADLHITAWQQRHGSSREGDKAIVQFHPSYAYEDFIEGIRPVGIKQGQIQLELTDGVFKRFCRKAARWEIDYFKRTSQPITSKTTIADLPNTADQGLWSFVTGLDKTEKVVDHLPPYFFIIDEINRAELSRVLGEIMYSLEYRGFDPNNKIKTQYSGLVREIDAQGTFLFIENENYFFIPHNVFLVGTMNVIDRSVEAFDFALRRRFRWIELNFNEVALREILKELSEADVNQAIQRFKSLNEGIEEESYLGRDYRIGHAYGKYLVDYAGPGGSKGALRFLWQNYLEPLLEEYFRGMGRAEKIEEKIRAFRTRFLG